MDVNALPRYDTSDNPTGCCPRFDPKGWDDIALHFRNKPFVRATTRSILHIPIDMGRVYKRTFAALTGADAMTEDQFIVLSRDLSAWKGEHLFAVDRDVPGQEMVRLSGDYLSRVFAGHYRNAPRWQRELMAQVAARGKRPGDTYFFYTTCPKCAKVYGKNYVVGVTEIR